MVLQRHTSTAFCCTQVTEIHSLRLYIWNAFLDLVVLSMFPHAIPDDLLVFLGSIMPIREQYFPVIIWWTGLTSANNVRLLLTVHLLYTVATNTLTGTCTNHLQNYLTLAPLVLPFLQVRALNPSPSCLLSSGCTGYLAHADGLLPCLGKAPLPLPFTLAVLFCSTVTSVTLQAAAHATIL